MQFSFRHAETLTQSPSVVKPPTARNVNATAEGAVSAG